MTRRLRFLAFVALLSVVGVFAACGDDDAATPTPDNTAEKQAIADFVVQMASYDGSTVTQADIDYYMAHITDGFVQAFGTEDVAACEADAEECIGSPLTNAAVDPSTVEIDGNDATALLTSEDASFGVGLTKSGDDFKMSRLFASDDHIPAGVEKVDLALSEFGFTFESDSDLVKSGKFAFAVKNDGVQTHEVAMAQIPEDANIDELLQSDDPEAAGVEDITFKFPYVAGDEADMNVPELEAGRYVLVCFLPNTAEGEEKGTPHALLGMVRDFHVE